MAALMSEEKRNFSGEFHGQLFKYTNVMKGWCPRWFRLEPTTGILDYYLTESESSQKPRGSIELSGAVISPSDEDSHTFTVSSANGEAYKLRASDAKERQEWVNRLRAVAEDRETKPYVTPSYKSSYNRLANNSPWDNYQSSVYLPATNPTTSVKNWAHAHGEADQQLRLIADLYDLVQREVDELPTSSEISNTDKDLVQLTASSLLTLNTLQDAIRILENDAYRPSVLD